MRLVIKALFITTILCVSLVASHGHSHDHGHSHSHGHDHGHSHDHVDAGHGHSHGHSHDHVDAGHSHSHGHSHDHSDSGHSHSHGHSHDHVDSAQGQKATHKSITIAKTERTTADIWTSAILATVLIGGAPIIFLFFVPIDAKTIQSGPGKNFLNVLLAFAVGGLLGDVFLHLLPHSKPHDHSHDHGHGHDHTADTIIGLWVLAGFTVFLLIEKLVRGQVGEGGHAGHSHSHGHSHKETEQKNKEQKEAKDKKEEAVVESKTSVSAYLNLAADFSHNFTDGLAIGASFLASQELGYINTVAILFHELPHEIGDFAILLQSGFTKRQAILAQLSTAVGAMAGTILGLLANNLADSSAWVLPFTAGGFVYVAAVSVVPSLLEQPSSVWQTTKEMTALCLGVGIMALIGIFESH